MDSYDPSYTRDPNYEVDAPKFYDFASAENNLNLTGDEWFDRQNAEFVDNGAVADTFDECSSPCIESTKATLSDILSAKKAVFKQNSPSILIDVGPAAEISQAEPAAPATARQIIERLESENQDHNLTFNPNLLTTPNPYTASAKKRVSYMSAIQNGTPLNGDNTAERRVTRGSLKAAARNGALSSVNGKSLTLATGRRPIFDSKYQPDIPERSPSPKPSASPVYATPHIEISVAHDTVSSAEQDDSTVHSKNTEHLETVESNVIDSTQETPDDITECSVTYSVDSGGAVGAVSLQTNVVLPEISVNLASAPLPVAEEDGPSVIPKSQSRDRKRPINAPLEQNNSAHNSEDTREGSPSKIVRSEPNVADAQVSSDPENKTSGVDVSSHAVMDKVAVGLVGAGLKLTRKDRLRREQNIARQKEAEKRSLKNRQGAAASFDLPDMIPQPEIRAINPVVIGGGTTSDVKKGKKTSNFVMNNRPTRAVLLRREAALAKTNRHSDLPLGDASAGADSSRLTVELNKTPTSARRVRKPGNNSLTVPKTPEVLKRTPKKKPEDTALPAADNQMAETYRAKLRQNQGKARVGAAAGISGPMKAGAAAVGAQVAVVKSDGDFPQSLKESSTKKATDGLVVKTTTKPAPTTPQGFNFRTAERALRRSLNQQEQKDQRQQATTTTDNQNEGVVVPKVPVVLDGPDLYTRCQEQLKRREQWVEDQQRLANKHTPFRAQPMRCGSPDPLPKKPEVSVVEPVPFDLRVDRRGERYQAKFRDQMAKEEQLAAKSRQFHATEYREPAPFEPKIVHKEGIVPEAFEFHIEERLQMRREYDRKIAASIEAKEQGRRERDERVDREERAKARAEANQFKARAAPRYTLRVEKPYARKKAEDKDALDDPKGGGNGRSSSGDGQGLV